ncbi:hypothetical protein DFH11DRAFT_1511925, partial [Phellopilus nigrolimitatus]
TLVVALASWLFNIYGVRRMGAPMQKRESNFKFLTRALGCMVDGVRLPLAFLSFLSLI